MDRILSVLCLGALLCLVNAQSDSPTNSPSPVPSHAAASSALYSSERLTSSASAHASVAPASSHLASTHGASSSAMHSSEAPQSSAMTSHTPVVPVSSHAASSHAVVFSSALHSSEAPQSSAASHASVVPTSSPTPSSHGVMTSSALHSSEAATSSMTSRAPVVPSSSVASSQMMTFSLSPSSAAVPSSVFVSSSLAAQNTTSSPTPPTTSAIKPTPSPSANATSHAVMSTSIQPNMTSSAAMMSSAVPPTTKAPVIVPATDVEFSVAGKNGSCVTINGTVTFEVDYMTLENKTATAKVDLTRVSSKVTGTCPKPNLVNTTSSISVDWDKAYTMRLSFSFTADGEWYLSEIYFKANAKLSKEFVNATKDSYSATKKFNQSENGVYHASGNHSYLCHDAKEVKLDSSIKADFKHIQIQPSHRASHGGFNKADMCPSDSGSTKTNSLVPIIVGCALAGLIVIVLIAYLVGRRKSSRGYQQV